MTLRSSKPLAGIPRLFSMDEVQRCRELLLEIRRAVDHDRTPGRFLLSGSSNFALLDGIVESLAGRAVYLTLDPFTRREIRGDLGDAPMVRRIFEQGGPPRKGPARGGLYWGVIARGGLPLVALGAVRRPRIWFTGFEQTYLERDVRDLSRLTDPVSFRAVLRLAALRTAQVLNISELARDARLSAATADRYIGLLVASFVLSRVPPFLANETTRLIKSPKLFVCDTGLAAHLAGVGTRGTVHRGSVARRFAGDVTSRRTWRGFWQPNGRAPALRTGISRVGTRWILSWNRAVTASPWKSRRLHAGTNGT